MKMKKWLKNNWRLSKDVNNYLLIMGDNPYDYDNDRQVFEIYSANKNMIYNALRENGVIVNGDAKCNEDYSLYDFDNEEYWEEYEIEQKAIKKTKNKKKWQKWIDEKSYTLLRQEIYL